MLKASSSLVVSLVSWSAAPPDHAASVLLVAPNLGNIVTGGRDGSLVIWTLSNNGKSYQPSFLDARLLFCCGRYPCIVVMHAMQLTPLYTLSSTSQPDWIADLSVFTHSNLHQEVVLGISASGVITVWTLTGDELLGETTHEHESRIVVVSSKILQIHCCRQFPRLVLVVSTSEWRVLDAIDCSTLAKSPAPPDVSLTGGAFFHKEYVAIYTNHGEVYVFRLSLEVTSKNANKQVEKPRMLATLLISRNTGPGCSRHSKPRPPTFAHFELLKSCHANLTSLGIRNAVTLFFACRADGSLHAWCLTTDLLIAEGQVSTDAGSPPATPSAKSTKAVVTCCIIVYSTSENAPFHDNHDRQSLASCPPAPRLILGLESGEILVAPLSDFLCSLLSSSTAAAASSFLRTPTTAGVHVNGDISLTGLRHRNHYCLSGHKGAVLCLLHPYGFNSQTNPTSRGGANNSLLAPFRPNILCSGGVDCSVRIWDLDPHTGYSDLTLACLCVFYCHAAPVVGLVSCICSVDHEGSVALLSPQDKQLVLRARTGPGGAVGARVHSIGWRLPEMLLLLLDEDGNLTIWDAASGRLERYETGAQAEDLFQTASDIQLVTPSLSTWTPVLAAHLYYRGGGGEGGFVHAVSINENAAAGASFLTLPSSLLIDRGDLKHPEAFAAPVLLQAVASCVTSGAQDRRAEGDGVDEEEDCIVHGPAAFVFHFDVEALVRNLLAMASPESSDALNTPSDYASVPLGLSSCWELTRLLLSLICPLEAVNDMDSGLLRFLGSVSCRVPVNNPPFGAREERFQFACASEGGCLTLRLPTSDPLSTAPSIYSLPSSIATPLYLSIMSVAESLCSLPSTRAAELVGSAATADGREPVAFLRALALFLTRQVTADLSTHLRTPATLSFDGCHLNLCLLVSFWQAKCLQIRFAARTLIYAYLDLLPFSAWRQFLSHWSGCLPQPPPPSLKSHHTQLQEGNNPLVFNVNGSGYGSPSDGSYEEGINSIQYPGGDFSPRADIHTPGSPFPLQPKDSSSPLKAAATCPSLDRLLMALTLDSAFYDNFPPPPTLPVSDPTLHNPLARRLKIGAILLLGVVGSRISAEALLAPEVAARDLAPDDWPPPQAYLGLAAPFYGPFKSTGGYGGEAALAARSQKAKLFEDLELPRRVARLLESVFSYIPTPKSDGSDLCLLSSASVQSSTVRRAAIDILTRGFSAWEPYLDAAQFVNSLLTISADADSTLGIFKLGSVLTEVADFARSARQGLWSLTYARPHLVVLTLSLALRRLGPQLGNFMAVGSQAAEKPPTHPSASPSVARAPTLRVVMSSPALAAPIFTPPTNDSSGQQASSTQGARFMTTSPSISVSLHSSLFLSTEHVFLPPLLARPLGGAASAALNMQPQLPLLRARSELIRLFEGVCERRPVDLLPILPEFVEVLLVCVDRIRLKERGLDVTFPALQSHSSFLLCFLLPILPPPQYTQAHEAPVTAVKFSSDGRQMVSYSLNENRLRVWQLSTSGLFGMGGQQVKALANHPLRPLAPPGSAPKLHERYRTDAQGCIEAQLPTICLDWTEAACINILQNGQRRNQAAMAAFMTTPPIWDLSCLKAWSILSKPGVWHA
ncbi:unnamed protein product [Schistocephalus solidus]|uniref:WD_REPEATS_REGION domain-containing protein n=1 Tax=Schistocephalus solidus TaxID=70667 RepID=A0A183SK49_SCHSO|nr:unnamed protein product [Schistocephalus solidus]